MKVIIVGGVAGGATTAARLRRLDKDVEIVILERGPYISYANCGLPYHISGVIDSQDDLLLTTPETMKTRFNIDVRVRHEVIEVLPAEKKVLVRNLNTAAVFEEGYDKLVLSTGSSPLKPPIPGIDNERIKSLWTVPDTVAIKSFIKQHQVKNAVIVGGGFIGIEMAENLHHLGIDVSIVEKQNQVLNNLDYEMAQLLHQDMNSQGIHFHLGKGVVEFNESIKGIQLQLDDGSTLTSDLVILAIGVRPNSQLADSAGIAKNQRGGIIVDPYLQTSVEDIYALGDVIEVEHFINHQKTMIPLAGPANKQGRILADTLTGNPTSYQGTQGSSIVKVFNLAAASTGLSEKQLIAQGMALHKDYETVLIRQNSHAGYYPDAAPLTMKLIYDKEHFILGSQIIGKEGVDKRIDVLATAIRFRAKVTDLMNLELAYAPPFSSAKDPVNMVGYVAENIIRGLVSFISPEEYSRNRSEVITLDVREHEERALDSISGSYHIPYGELEKRCQELDPAATIVIYCAAGVRAYNSARILRQKGFHNILVLSGGIDFYRSALYNPY